MSELLYHSNSYLKEFDAVVTSIVENTLVLDRTAFYPGGGGQPSDTGTIKMSQTECKILKVSRKDNAIIHEIDGPIPDRGTRIHGLLDWERRYSLMRTHTALHILCGVIWRNYKSQVTGGNMQPLQARMDFELEQMSADFATEVEFLANEEIAASRNITAYTLPRSQAFAIPDLIRTKINLLPENIPEIRVVNIEGLDLQADGGTHVDNTREVGAIKVVGHESKGRINKRLRIEITP